MCFIYRALVGAILSNSTGTLTQLRNGALYRCPLQGSSGCINMAVDDTGIVNIIIYLSVGLFSCLHLISKVHNHY